LSPRIRRFIAAIFWIVATSTAAFAGSAAVLLACSQNVATLWLAKFHTLVLLPSIVLYFLLDWWRPESRARLIGFIVPFIVAACCVAAVADILPPSFNGPAIRPHVVALVGALGGTFLAIRGKCRIDTFGIPRFQFSLSSLFVLVTLAALLCAAIKTFGPASGGFMFGWAIAAVLLSITFHGTDATPQGGWRSACSLAIAAAYGPFVAMFINTMVFNPSDDCRRVWLQLLWVAPGGMFEMLGGALLFRDRIFLPPFVAITMAGGLSIGLVGGTAWLARRIPLVRWIALAVIALLAAVGACAADALMRA
jgi:hypothetical protein